MWHCHCYFISLPIGTWSHLVLYIVFWIGRTASVTEILPLWTPEPGRGVCDTNEGGYKLTIDFLNVGQFSKGQLKFGIISHTHILLC